jgi:hypothetical protein
MIGCQTLYWRPGLKRKILLSAILVLLLVACQGEATNQPVAQITEDVEIIQVTATVIISPSPEPTSTSTEPRLLFISPAEGDAEIIGELRNSFRQQAELNGYMFEPVDDLDIKTITPEVKGIVIYGQDPGIATLTQSFPEIPVLSINVPGVQSSGNIYVLELNRSNADQASFLAGYLAAVITPDWRAGVISTADTMAGMATSLGFSNGVIFYCGLCRPAYPPFIAYPIIVNVPTSANDADYLTAVDSLVNANVKVVFIPSWISSDTLYQKLAEAGILVIGSGAPPPGLENFWVASIEPDLIAGIEQIGLGWLEGEGLFQVNVPYRFTRANAEYFSLGRQNMVGILQDDLQSGYIDTGVDPVTGEPRP